MAAVHAWVAQRTCKSSEAIPCGFDILQDPQERYDIFMNNYTEHTWTLVSIGGAIKDLMKTDVDYPPRKLLSLGYTGTITISNLPEAQVGEGAARQGRRGHHPSHRELIGRALTSEGGQLAALSFSYQQYVDFHILLHIHRIRSIDWFTLTYSLILTPDLD